MVEDKRIGEFCLPEQGKHVLVVGYVGAEMCIAAQDDRHLIALAEAQYLGVVAVGCTQSSCRLEGRVVDFQQRVALLGGQDNGFEEQLRRAVAWMADDVSDGFCQICSEHG